MSQQSIANKSVGTQGFASWANSSAIEKLIAQTKTETNLFESWSLMNTDVNLYFESELVDNFSFSLLQKLWTPDVLKDICEMCGLSVVKIIPYFDDSLLANEKDYRLTFICEKLN